jgi:hypothetical protein
VRVAHKVSDHRPSSQIAVGSCCDNPPISSAPNNGLQINIIIVHPISQQTIVQNLHSWASMALGTTWCYSFNQFQHIWYAYGKVVVPSSWRGDWGHPRMSVPWPQLWHVIVDAGSVQTQFTSTYWSCNLWTEHLFKIYTCQNSSLLQHFKVALYAADCHIQFFNHMPDMCQ